MLKIKETAGQQSELVLMDIIVGWCDELSYLLKLESETERVRILVSIGSLKFKIGLSMNLGGELF